MWITEQESHCDDLNGHFHEEQDCEAVVHVGDEDDVIGVWVWLGVIDDEGHRTDHNESQNIAFKQFSAYIDFPFRSFFDGSFSVDHRASGKIWLSTTLSFIVIVKWI